MRTAQENLYDTFYFVGFLFYFISFQSTSFRKIICVENLSLEVQLVKDMLGQLSCLSAAGNNVLALFSDQVSRLSVCLYLSHNLVVHRHSFLVLWFICWIGGLAGRSKRGVRMLWVAQIDRST